MNLNMFSRLISTSTSATAQHKLYTYFRTTPHFIFMDFGALPISRILQFPNVQRITLVSSSYDTVGSMINANVFPNLSYLRHLVDVSTSSETLDKIEKNLECITKSKYNHIDYEVSYLDFNNPRHLDIKKISNNFSGCNVGEITNKMYSKYLIEHIKATHDEYMKVINSINSEDVHLLQEVEELQLQKYKVIVENNRGELR
jgi:hypothetical protein